MLGTRARTHAPSHTQLRNGEESIFCMFLFPLFVIFSLLFLLKIGQFMPLFFYVITFRLDKENIIFIGKFFQSCITYFRKLRLF